MFFNLRHFLNQNRGKILVAIFIILAVILIIRFANYLASRALERDNTPSGTTSSSQYGSTSPNVLHTDSTIGTGSVDEEQASENQSLINRFVQACNNGDINQAYSYLSNSCKNEMFSTVEEFNTKYYTPIFSTKKEYNIENWISSGDSYTYKITFVEDILSSGIISDNIEDYVTVVTENGEKKLNVFRYIMNEQINQIGENDVISIEILDRDIYDEYEIYNIRATNKTENTIMINRAEDNDGIYVQYRGNDEHYGAFITEIYEQNLILQSNQTKYLSIRINKIYNEQNSVDNITFSDIINNKDAFDQIGDQSVYSDISTLEIKL